MKRREVVVTGTGALAAAGDGAAALHRALCDGTAAPRPLSGLAAQGLPALPGTRMEEFDACGYLGRRGLRPLDRTARLAASAACRALEAGGLTERPDGVEVGLVLGTMFGSLDTIAGFDRRAVEAGPSYAKPMEFANSVINAAAGQTAIRHALTGLNATLSGGAASGLQAIAYAVDQIRCGRAEALLAGGADELCFASLHGFHRRGLTWSGNGDGPRPVPFDARRDGIAPGEGAALLLLESREAAAARGARVLARIHGHGAGFDLGGGAELPSGAAAVATAVEQALQDAEVAPQRLAALSASANGSRRLDRHEAAGVALALDGAAKKLPVTAIKAGLGEPLGAGGALQTVVLIEALRAGVLPGIRGLAEPEEGLPLPLAGAASRPLGGGYGLVTSVDFDGKAAALVLSAVAENDS